MRSATSPTLPLGLILGTTALVAVALAASPGNAQSETGDLLVTASIPEGCTVEGGTLDFGSYDPNDLQPLDGTGSIDLNCVTNGSVEIALGPGGNPSGSFRQLIRSGGGDLLTYQLYSDTPGGSPWDDGAQTVIETVSLGLHSVPVHGQILAGQVKAPGAYSDTVVITVTPVP